MVDRRKEQISGTQSDERRGHSGRQKSPALNAAIRATIVQTARAMARGTLAGVIIGGMLFSLEIGLNTRKATLTWQEMIEILNWTERHCGRRSFVITGLLVGLALMFPFLIPIMLRCYSPFRSWGWRFLVGFIRSCWKGMVGCLERPGTIGRPQ